MITKLKKAIKWIFRPITRPFFNHIRLIVREELSYNKDGLQSLEIKQFSKVHLDENDERIRIENFKQYDEFINRFNPYQHTNEEFNNYSRGYKLCLNSFYQLYGSYPPECDPFSDEYRNWEMGFFCFITGKNYNVNNEGCSFDVAKEKTHPLGYNWSVDHRVNTVSRYMELIKLMKLENGMSILEMGFGLGILLEILGRFQCKISGIEASKDHVELVEYQLKQQHINAILLRGDFLDIENDDRMKGPYDIVIFEASFHHCNDPVRVLKMLHKKLNQNGRILFAQEPIYQDFERPWGIRYDGETAYQMRFRGWLELGFRRDFFEELLVRTGFMLSNVFEMQNGYPLIEARKIN